MRLGIVSPVGPGHNHIAKRCAKSIEYAKVVGTGPFTDVEVFFVDDTQAKWGRAAARNYGIMRARDTDWIYFVDSDDMMNSTAMETFGEVLKRRPAVQAVWGQGNVMFYGRRIECTSEIKSMTWTDVIRFQNLGTFGMGMFVRTDAARKLRFDESIAHCEGFEFCVSLLSTVPWVKTSENITLVDRDCPSSPDHYQGCSAPWTRAFAAHTLKWKFRGPGPLGEEELRKRHAAERERLHWCSSMPNLLEM